MISFRSMRKPLMLWGVKEEELKKTGTRSGIVKEYCDMFYRLFDDIFGDGTGENFSSEREMCVFARSAIQILSQNVRKVYWKLISGKMR